MSELPVEISLSPPKTPTATLVSAAVGDISERKRTDAAMRMMSTLLDSSIDAIVGHAADGTVTVWNPAAEAMFGFEAAEVIGRHQVRIVTEDGQDRGPELQARAQRDASVIGLEALAQHKDGSRADVSLTMSPVFDVHGVALGSFGIIRDISESKRRQLASEADQARLAAAQQMVRMGSYEIDIVTGQRWWSEEYSRVIGVDDTEPSSRDLLLSVVHPEDQERVERLLQQLDSGGPTAEFSFRIVLAGEISRPRREWSARILLPASAGRLPAETGRSHARAPGIARPVDGPGEPAAADRTHRPFAGRRTPDCRLRGSAVPRRRPVQGHQ